MFSLNWFILFWMNWLIYFVFDNFEMPSSGLMRKYDSEKFDHEGRKMKVSFAILLGFLLIVNFEIMKLY